MEPVISKEIISKWMPIVKTMDFQEKDLERVCGYCEWHALKEIELANFTQDPFKKNDFKSTLPLSINALSKLSSLDNIEFTPQPAFIDTKISRNLEGVKAENIARTVKAFRINASFDNFYETAAVIGKERAIEEYESLVVNEVVHQINEILDQGHTLVIFQVISQFAEVQESNQINKTLMAISRFWHPGLEEPETVSINDL